jgi:hypothetical protein
MIDVKILASTAQTGEGIALCLQKVAAELLGIKLTKQVRLNFL